MKRLLPMLKENNKKVNDGEKTRNLRQNFKHFIQLVNLKSLSVKLVVTFMLLIIIPVFSVAYISVSTASGDLIGKAKESLSNATIQTVNYYEITLNQIEQGYTMQIAFDPAVSSFMRTETYSDPMEKLSLSTQAKKSLGQVVASYSNYINAAMVVKNDDHAVCYPFYLDTEMKLTGTSWYKKIVDSSGGIWMEEQNEGLSSTYQSDTILSYGKVLKNSVKNKIDGIVRLDIKSDAFQNILSSVHVGKNAHSYAVSNSHRIISEMSDTLSKDDLSFDTNILLQKSAEYAKSKDSFVFTQNYKGENYIVSFTKSKKTGWIFVTTLPESEIMAVAKGIQTKVALLGLVFILIAILIGILVSLSMTKPIKKLMEVMEKAEKGDLRVNAGIKRTDEIGRLAKSFESMISQIKGLVMQSKEAAVEVETSSNSMATISKETARVSSEIARAIEEVASGSSNQTAEVEVSVRNVAQLADKISNTVESTKVMEAASDEVKNLTSNGIVTVDLLNKKAAETNQITANVVNEISELNEYVKNINNITNVLKAIADQTNLLALNAAIEAARAGESGKGFAVVADEVRKLAEQSNSFTKEIQNLVKRILNQTENTTDMVHRAEVTIKEQSDMVEQTAQVFSKISNATGVLVTNITKIADDIAGIDKYKERVMSSIESISSVTEQTAASTEEVSASTEEQLASIEELDRMASNLNELAQNLVSAMEKFKV